MDIHFLLVWVKKNTSGKWINSFVVLNILRSPHLVMEDYSGMNRMHFRSSHIFLRSEEGNEVGDGVCGEFCPPPLSYGL